MSEVFWVYVLACADGSLYAGHTQDLARRLAAHRAGTASKYTRSFRPRRLVGCWQVPGPRGAALRVERFFKSMSRAQKLEALAAPRAFARRVDERLGLEIVPSARVDPSAPGR